MNYDAPQGIALPVTAADLLCPTWCYHLVLADEINRATPSAVRPALNPFRSSPSTSGTLTHELEISLLVHVAADRQKWKGNLHRRFPAQADPSYKILVTYQPRELTDRGAHHPALGDLAHARHGSRNSI